MKNRKNISVLVLAGLSLLFLVLALSRPRSSGDTGNAAARVERIVECRLRALDMHIERRTSRIPEDMVIYRYSGDSLVSWSNQFPVYSDKLSSANLPDRLRSFRRGSSSPLSEIGPELAFFNFGSGWYLSRRFDNDDETVVIGLEIMNSRNVSSFNGVNPKLRLNDKYSIKPLSSSGGSVVCVDGVPMFKILYDSHIAGTTADATFVWIAFALFICAVLRNLFNSRTLRNAFRSSAATVLVMVLLYWWGYNAQNDVRLFSPLLYAGKTFFSLGAVLIVNLALFLIAWYFYLVRSDIELHLNTIARRRTAVAIAIFASAVIALYSVMIFRSIVLNSTFSLEYYKFSGLTIYSVVVFFSFITMLLSIPMLLKTINSPIDFFSSRGRLLYSSAAAVFIVISVAVLGVRKEQERINVWANRLAFDRDITLELRLRRLEPQIASDIFIPALARLDNASTVQNRIIETYFPRDAQDYNISVTLLTDTSIPQEIASFAERSGIGDPLFENSRFRFVDSQTGRPRYDGVFLYYHPGTGVVRMLLEVEPKVAQHRGYADIFNLSLPGRVAIPEYYSYARYKGTELQLFDGTYPYPTRMEDDVCSQIYDQRQTRLKTDAYRHFVSLVDNDEAVIISRTKMNVFSYVIGMVSVTLVIFLILSLYCIGPRKRTRAERAYYKNRISAVIMTSLILVLVVLATVSVVFVYRSNEENMNKVMSGKINAIQAMAHDRLGAVESIAEIRRTDLSAVLKGIGDDTSSDVTLYSPDGRLLVSTCPEVFERMLLGWRINQQAYESIIIRNKRYYISRERQAGRHCSFLYAPLVSESGNVLAIICSPYTEMGYNIEGDAVLHSMTVLTVFIILLLLARLMVSAVLERMFKPLSEMGRKMSSANLDSLEYIEYDRDDEIRSLVLSYNRMVSELSESTKQLAQAERDKAWSGMARQVAHEIKNPLTPMRLKLQHVLMLKQKNDPNWKDKFDEAAAVILDHIDILSDTANEFSTFAKLYSEEHTRIDLDGLLKEEISMYDNRSDIRFEYRGFSDASVMGPKPQLTRVFVNLINNAVQAVEECGGSTIVVSLRNSTRDGFYDIVVEDDGPGVSDENIDRLFTPNFTTKSGGSGLGLAISRSILEKCAATIEYSRSFTLGGACFTVTYPK